MSYTYLPEAPRARPAVVTAAVALLYVAAAALVLDGLLLLSLGGPLGHAMDAAYRNQQEIPENFGSSFAWVVVGVLTGIYVLVGIGIAVLAIFDGKGRNGARITTWVFMGLLTLCCGCGGLFSAISGGAGFTGNISTTGSSGQIDQQAMQRILEQELPSWYTPVSATLSIVLALVGLAVIILLALPASNAFFRKTPETWTPPSWPGAPGDPGYPQAPGYPQVPGTPGYPEVPGTPGYPQAPGTPGYPPAPGAPGTDPGYPPPPGGYPPPPAQ
jgi:hypothetical protein